MADSDNTTTMAFVTRGRKTINIMATDIRQCEPDTRRGGAEAKADPAFTLARAWRDAHARCLALCRRQQRLENRLARTVGYPASPAPDDLSESARWESGDLRYSKTKDAEERAAEAAELLLDELARTPARSVDGLIAKLEVVLLESEVGDTPSGFPWPQLRSVLADLKTLTNRDRCSPPSLTSRRSSSQGRA
ncbi:hypothetical protein M2281_005468 [Mesorhizobium soli]|uniref:hypothetical protein n=1 Tax=Pseudaminobacter soli (ex Li et al. 2025) TaxID=1295366 RepID=UPI002475971F|nr:hypothetical protein [Mesorhizobium soli]MDH6234847.1 hypothetical protein [Mesorhizobium soli]